MVDQAGHSPNSSNLSGVSKDDLMSGALKLLSLIDPGRIKSEKRSGPLLVEIAGTSKSGKTTIREALYTFFRRAKFQVHALPEAAGTIEVTRADQFLYTLRAGVYNLTNLLDRLHDPRYHIVLFERSVFDNLCWWDVISRERLISEEELQVMQGFFSQSRITNLLDAVVYLTCPPEMALTREPSIVSAPGRRMNPKTHGIITDAFERTAENFQNRFRAFFKFNNDLQNPMDAARAVGDFLVGTLLKQREETKEA